jgi:hypothetical protein
MSSIATAKPLPDVRRMTLQEWSDEGTRRFGPIQMKWKFVCPACGFVQSVEDFRPFKAHGATVEDARFNCIGRFAGPKREALGGNGPGPCNYTSGGLFDLRKLTVVLPDGKEIRTFDFAEVPMTRSPAA